MEECSILIARSNPIRVDRSLFFGQADFVEFVAILIDLKWYIDKGHLEKKVK